MVTKAADGGEVRVTLGTRNLGTFSLAGKGKQKVVPVARFAKVHSGKVTIRVVSPTGKRVAIDGLVVAK